MLNSISGKPFDANDYTTWTPGTTFDFSREGDIGSAEGKTRRTSARTLKGVVEEVRGNTLVVDIDSIGRYVIDKYERQNVGNARR